jgi:hypothetical protein
LEAHSLNGTLGAQALVFFVLGRPRFLGEAKSLEAL